MSCDFDRFIDRRDTWCSKWDRYEQDVLPMWVADMDFPSPEPVIRALRERVEHGIFGYPIEPPEMREVVVTRLERLYGWRVDPSALLFIPGVVRGFNLACHAVADGGGGVLLQTPIYYPMLDAPGYAGLRNDEMELTRLEDGRYVVDMERMEAAVRPDTRLFMLCNPHNPVGRVYRREELEAMADFCLRHGLIICSDEIHCELLMPGHRHLPIASLSPEVARRTITLMAPSKTFNIAGLHFSVAIIEDKELRERYQRAYQGLVGSVGIMGYTAALAAYRDGDPWLQELLQYLSENLAYLGAFVAERLPGVSMSPVEGTYLAWLDCRSADLDGNPHEFFIRQARVALNDGARFGRGGEGFVRLNFGCCRSVLQQALERMERALKTR
ncbi:MAG: putative C-S lyase [Chloroflexi bacterium]|nr:putative C-S lyase [Chloroflexota bacterium]